MQPTGWRSGKLWTANHSLYHAVPWLPRQYGLPAVSGLLALINVAAIIWMAVSNLYHLDYYTYWNFTIVTVFLLGTAILYPFGGWPSALFTLVWGPLTFGSTALVVLIILIVVAIDERVYIVDTAADPSSLDPQYDFSQIRTGDWIIHGLPWLEVLVVLLFDYQLYFRALIYHWERSGHWRRRWLYWLWFAVAPLVPMLIYVTIFDVRKKYTDKVSRLAGVFIAIGLDLVVMGVYALSLRTSEPNGVVLPDFYPAYLHAPPLAPE